MAAVWRRDAAGNASRGDALLIDCRGSVVYGATRLVAVLGADDLIVVDSADAVLVCPRQPSAGRAPRCGRPGAWALSPALLS